MGGGVRQILQSGCLLMAGCVAEVVEVSPSDAGTTFDTFPPITTATATQGSDATGTIGTDGSGDVSTGSTAGTTGSSTGDPIGLQGGDPLVRYWLDEPAGSRATELVDASPLGPLPLPLDYAEVMTWTESAPGRRGLTWAAAGQDGTAATPVSGTKLQMLEGASQATIEVVCDVLAVTPNDSRLSHIGAGSDQGDFTLSSGSSDVLMVRVSTNDGSNTATWNYALLGKRSVFHVVVDLPAPDPTERIRLYADGVRLTDPISFPTLPADATIDLDSNALYSIGNRGDGNRSFEGTLHYAAIYLSALDEDVVAHNAGFLLDRDDP